MLTQEDIYKAMLADNKPKPKEEYIIVDSEPLPPIKPYERRKTPIELSDGQDTLYLGPKEEFEKKLAELKEMYPVHSFVCINENSNLEAEEYWAWLDQDLFEWG